MNRKQQEAKKYLSQAFGLNQRIESKLNQIEELHNLAPKSQRLIRICRRVRTGMVPEWKIPSAGS